MLDGSAKDTLGNFVRQKKKNISLFAFFMLET